MKKKILVIALAAVLALTAVAGATLAYFTDRDSADNKFVIGDKDANGPGVKIELIEQERGFVRDDDGELTDEWGLVGFEQNKSLYPIAGSAQGEKDKYGLPTAANYVDKIVTVKNWNNDAYVRVYIAVPAALENSDASKNILHWNIGNKFSPNGDYAQAGAEYAKEGQLNAPDYTNMGKIVQLESTTFIDGIEYNVYYQTYNKVLTKEEVTGSAFMVGMYLDENVDYDQDTETYTINGNEIDFDFSNGVTIPVYAIGVQAAGFDNADEALNKAFGEDFIPEPWKNSGN